VEHEFNKMYAVAEKDAFKEEIKDAIKGKKE